jgi:hypothetical protein
VKQPGAHVPTRRRRRSVRRGTHAAPCGRGARPHGCRWSSCRRPPGVPSPTPAGSSMKPHLLQRWTRRRPAPGWRWSQWGRSTPRCTDHCTWVPTGDLRTQSCPPHMGTARRLRSSCHQGTTTCCTGWSWRGQPCTPRERRFAAGCCPRGRTRPHRHTGTGWRPWTRQGSSTQAHTAHCMFATSAQTLRRTRPQGKGSPLRSRSTAPADKAPAPPGSASSLPSPAA